MKTLTSPIPPPSTSAPFGNASYLGPAKVLAVQGRRVQLECPDAFPWALLALAHTYRPVEGDTVLAVNRGDDWYVIGVIDGRGDTRIVVPGNLEFLAPCGRIDLASRDGVHLKGELVEIVAKKLELTAKSAVERFVDLTQWVRGTFQQRAGRVRTRVEGDHEISAGHIAHRSKGDVKIDGKMIHLG